VRLVGNPELATVLKVISALGLQLHVSAVDEAKLAVEAAPRVDRGAVASRPARRQTGGLIVLPLRP